MDFIGVVIIMNEIKKEDLRGAVEGEFPTANSFWAEAIFITSFP